MIYNPYNSNTNPGWPNHPSSESQQNYDPRHGLWGATVKTPYGEAVSYPQAKEAIEEHVEAIKVKPSLNCENLPLAMTYVRPQVYQGINSPAEALKQGTAFSELYRPYTPKKGGHVRHESNE